MEYKIDAKNQILGRIASRIAKLLLGKGGASFDPAKVANAKVIVTNTEKLNFSGKKMSQKLYRHHTGFHGGLKEKKLSVLFGENPQEVLKRAVWGMLPKNRLRVRRMKNLILYKRSI